MHGLCYIKSKTTLILIHASVLFITKKEIKLSLLIKFWQAINSKIHFNFKYIKYENS